MMKMRRRTLTEPLFSLRSLLDLLLSLKQSLMAELELAVAPAAVDVVRYYLVMLFEHQQHQQKVVGQPQDLLLMNLPLSSMITTAKTKGETERQKKQLSSSLQSLFCSSSFLMMMISFICCCCCCCLVLSSSPRYKQCLVDFVATEFALGLLCFQLEYSTKKFTGEYIVRDTVDQANSSYKNNSNFLFVCCCSVAGMNSIDDVLR